MGVTWRRAALAIKVSPHRSENGDVCYFDLKFHIQKEILFSYFSVISQLFGDGKECYILKFGTFKIHVF